ncbi:hypothetical protein BGX33_002319 [Mortierella sp. NVP41]|nr:hypothetical protein BGX33_002319 [Mortierella sp. NVP41]
MSCYICRQCARGPSRITPRILPLSSRQAIPQNTRLSSGLNSRSLSTQAAPAPNPSSSSSSNTSATTSPRSNTALASRTLAASKPHQFAASTSLSKPEPAPSLSTATTKSTTTSSRTSSLGEGDKHTATAGSVSHVRSIQRRVDQLAHNLEVDSLYLQFWKICQTATIEEQRRIWSSNSNSTRHASSRQESIYRAFNSPTKPKASSPPNSQQDILTIHYDKPSATKSGTKSKPTTTTTATPLTFTLQFLGQSHAKRLLQMHQYFEQVLGIQIGYEARIALLVAFSSRGDMITTLNLFRQWQRPSSRLQTDRATGGKEMYSAVIRGLIGRNFQDSERRSFYVRDDPASGIRNQGVTQIYTALELFYDLLRQGGTPTFETYHSLIVGLSTFKNDMEAAELLLDHMIVRKKKPYVQVLHVMCREYARRKDFASVERIFGMLKEYGIRPRAVTCNIMLRAIFQMSTLEALQYLGHSHSAPHQFSRQEQPGEQDPNAIAEQLKRHKVQHLLEYMRENRTAPNERTFSILCYGFGHMKSGFPDLQELMAEMLQGPSALKPNLVVLNSLLFAHLNHSKIRKAESILDQISRSFHPFEDSYPHSTSPRQQTESPFLKQESRNAVSAVKEQETDMAVDLPRIPMVPGKGAFHALMLAYVEQGDITSMERILDKMIQAQQQQRDQHDQRRQEAARLRSKIRSRSLSRSTHASPPSLQLLPMVDLEADEYTATIMLLGYLTQQDFRKVELIQQQIRAHPDWRSSSLFLDRDENRQELIDFVRHQSSKEIARRSLLQAGEDDDSRDVNAAANTTTTKPLSGDLEGELDDDIEIDVTTLSAKLRGLMNSSPSSSSSS